MQTNELIVQLDHAFDLRKLGDYAEALHTFEDLERLSTHPNDISLLWLCQATCLTDLGRPEDAQELLARVDKTHLVLARQIDLEYEKARVERALGHPSKSLELVKKGLEMVDALANTDEVSVLGGGLRTLQGILLAESNKCDEALPILDQVPLEDIGWAETRLLLGDCSYKRRHYREAIDYYLSLVSAPNITGHIFRNDALRNIGCAYHQLGDYARAVEYLKMVKDAYEGYPDLRADLLRFLASAYSHLGMPQESDKYGRFSKGNNSIH